MWEGFSKSPIPLCHLSIHGFTGREGSCRFQSLSLKTRILPSRDTAGQECREGGRHVTITGAVCHIWCLLDCLEISGFITNTEGAPLCAYSKNETQAKWTSELSLDPPGKGGDPIGQVPSEVGRERHQTGTWGADIYSHELAETLRSDEVMLEAERGPAEVIGFPGPGLL